MKKFALVDPEELKRLKMGQGSTENSREFHTVDQRLNAMARLHSNMEKTLEGGENDDLKAKLYSQAFQEFLELKDRTPSSSLFQLPTKKPELPISNITKTVPKNFRTKAEQLAEWIKQSGTMAWDETGRLIIDGKPMENTNIIDLINDALRRRTQFSPYGRDVFAENLRKKKAPHELVGNEAYWEDENGAFSTPPQHFPRQLSPSTSGKKRPPRISGVAKKILTSAKKKGRSRSFSDDINWSTDLNL